MSRSKSSLAKSSVAKPSTAETVSPGTAAPDTAAKLTTDLSQVEAMPSPALDLQENLRNAWTRPAATAEARPEERKIPIGWALTVVLVGCAAVWACVALVIF